MDAAAAGHERRPNPRAVANPVSVLFYWWTRSLFWRGRKRGGLTADDIYETLPADRASPLVDRLEKHWRREQSATRPAGRPPSLARAIGHCFAWVYAVYGIGVLFHSCVVRVAYPLFLGRLILYFSPGSTQSKEEAFGWAGGLVLATALNILLFHHINLGTQELGMRARVAVTSLIYRKVLRLSQAALSRVSAGQLVNLLSNDVARFDQLPMYLHYVWVMPLQAIIVTYFIWEAVGVSAFIGVAALFLQTVPVQSYMSKLTSSFRLRVAIRTDERVRLMAEIVAGIQVIKMYAWEKPFEKLVEAARTREVKVLRGANFLRGVYLAFMVFSERTALFITLLSYVLMGNSLTADRVFSLAQFFNVLQLSMAIFYPQAVQMAAEASVSIKRIESFLAEEEHAGTGRAAAEDGEKRAADKAELIETVFGSGLDDDGKVGGVSVVGLRARWLPNAITDTLANVSMTVPPGKLCAVVGPVGAGKSSLLLSLLGELSASAGSASAGGPVAYAAQEPWLFSASVRHNVLFGRPFDARRYRDVVRACALQRDLQLLPRGDLTPVGDRGASLSGGQRARIALARAVYRDADIYLLDDPLSAVDAHVSRHLFDECICTLLAGKTRILVTHQLQYLKAADHIVILNNGQVEAQGSFEALAAANINFSALLARDADAEDRRRTLSRQHSSNRSSVVGGDDAAAVAALTADEDEEESVAPAAGKRGSRRSSDGEADEAAEMLARGALDRSLYSRYFTAGSGCCLLFSVATLLLLGQLAATGCDFWVTYWTNQEESYHQAPTASPTDFLAPVTEIITTTEAAATTLLPTMMNETTQVNETAFRAIIPPALPPFEPWTLTRGDALAVYGALVAACIVFTTARAICFFAVTTRSSQGLHDTMFAALLRATMRFFDTNPAGRILNRFSKDMGSVDELLPKAMLEATQVFLVMLSILTLVVIANPYFIIIIVPLAALFYYIRHIYLTTAQDLKRLEGITKSPVYSQLTASLNGITTIRSARAQPRLINEFDVLQDEHTACWYLFIATQEAFGFCLDCFSFIFITALTFSFLIIDDNTSGGYVGLALWQALILTGMVQHGVRLSAEVSAHMTAVERLLQLRQAPQEPPLETAPGERPASGWPDKGEIVFDHTSLRYARGDPPVLRDLCLTVQPAHKVGVVGRTGAGKSSLAQALFRLAPLEGAIRVDDIDTQRLGLHDLRRQLAILPQVPVLFSASLRFNLSPFEGFADEVLWAALDEVEMKEAVESLDAPVSEGGSNFSVGQRQLLCLARAILRDNRILVLDEATANVDPQTDALIQETIRRKFADRTVLTIAHRLNTIMDSDKVLVMDSGEAVEYDHPHLLLQNRRGVFYSMVQETGPTMAQQLAHMAEEAYNKQHGERNNDETSQED